MENGDQKDTDETEIGEEQEEVETPTEEISQKVVFIREFNENTDDDNELWISNYDGTDMKSLGIKNVTEAYNGNSNGWIYYQTGNALNNIHSYNLNTDEQKDIVEPEPYANMEYVSVPRKGDVIVYRVRYHKKDEEGLPVMVDPYPNAYEGYFSYNIESDKKVYLGNFTGIGGWDKEATFFYISDQGFVYHEYDLSKGFYKINIITGEAQFLENKEKDCDVKYYLEEENNSFIFRCGEGEGSQLIVNKSGDIKLIENVETADIQPISIWFSPNRNYAIYIKAHYWEMWEGHFYDLILLDLSDLTTKALMLPEGYESYQTLFWLDDNEFITLFEKGDIPAENRDLVLVNIDTGEKKQITSFGDIGFSFQ